MSSVAASLCSPPADISSPGNREELQRFLEAEQKRLAPKPDRPRDEKNMGAGREGGAAVDVGVVGSADGVKLLQLFRDVMCIVPILL